MKLICYASFLNDGLNVNEVIESIKDISLKKNPRNGITGFLVYSNELFIQLIEGEKLNVDITYKIIEADNRHHDIKILFEQEIKERAFPDWAMHFEYSEELDFKVLNKVLNFQNKSLIISNEEIYDLFKDFLESKEAA